MSVNLSTAGPGLVFYSLPVVQFATAPVVVRDGAGCGLIYLRDGSTPNMRLNVSMGGVQSGIPIAPGVRLRQNFSSLAFTAGGLVYVGGSKSNLAVNGAGNFTYLPALTPNGTSGYANFIILTSHDADYTESDFSHPLVAPIILFSGNVSTGVFPTGTNTNSVFSVAGWKRLRVSVFDASPANTWHLTPIIFDGALNAYQLPNAAFDLGPSATLNPGFGGFVQIVDLGMYTSYPGNSASSTPLGGNAMLAYELDLVSGPGQATVGLTVEGIE